MALMTSWIKHRGGIEDHQESDEAAARVPRRRGDGSSRSRHTLHLPNRKNGVGCKLQSQHRQRMIERSICKRQGAGVTHFKGETRMIIPASRMFDIGPRQSMPVTRAIAGLPARQRARFPSHHQKDFVRHLNRDASLFERGLDGSRARG